MVALVLCLLLFTSTPFGSAGPIGFHFVEGHHHTIIHFERYKDLIVIHTMLNDTLPANLILDTGTRSILLCGRKFKQLKNIIANRKIKVTGWGSSEGVEAALSYPNSLSVGDIKGTALGVAIITNRTLFKDRPQIDGIIGYELFVRFAVEINYKTQTIHLYDKLTPSQTTGFSSVPLEIHNARPQVQSTIHLKGKQTVAMKLLIDTGSSLGLTLFSKNARAFPSSHTREDIGIGLNGVVHGFNLYVNHFFLGGMKVENVTSYLIDVSHHPDDAFTFSGSLGAGFLKDHIVIFDYPSSKLFLRNHNLPMIESGRPLPWSGFGMPPYF